MPMTSETHQRNRGEEWDEVVARREHPTKNYCRAALLS